MDWHERTLNNTDEQAAAIWSQIEAETGDPRHRALLAALYRRLALPGRDIAALARAVQQFVQHHITYLREHPETYARASRTLQWRVGDCDDQSIVVCTLLRSAKVPCRLVIVGKGQPGAHVRASHVYAEAELRPGQWVALETVRRVPLGWSALDHWQKQGHRTNAWRYGDRTQMQGLTHNLVTQQKTR